MKGPFALSLLILSGVSLLTAQENPLSTELQQSWTRTKNNLLAAAEKMSEENYGFKPAPESQSFKDLVAHTADSAAGVCSGFNGERRQIGAASKTQQGRPGGCIKRRARRMRQGVLILNRCQGDRDDRRSRRQTDSPRRALWQCNPFGA